MSIVYNGMSITPTAEQQLAATQAQARVDHEHHLRHVGTLRHVPWDTLVHLPDGRVALDGNVHLLRLVSAYTRPDEYAKAVHAKWYTTSVDEWQCPRMFVNEDCDVTVAELDAEARARAERAADADRRRREALRASPYKPVTVVDMFGLSGSNLDQPTLAGAVRVLRYVEAKIEQRDNGIVVHLPMNLNGPQRRDAIVAAGVLAAGAAHIGRRGLDQAPDRHVGPGGVLI
jgi:hypothetical protein